MLTEIPEVQRGESGEPQLYTQYRENPDAFIDALVRQMELGVGPAIGRPLQALDRDEMRKIAKDMCFNGYWRFAGGLIFLIRCGVTNFLARKGTQIE